ncbi:phosphonate C-P lyase system protein PhnH [Paucibacter sp. APW11]|uniref:Phosphonate C-P lyase system protein PhnH n=1 Tax=Roseateles aquae TaxID=3077235 RepID=A0ABU3PII6_9BURK|nr:phosphonate C-P lyase system protein PhnH [Paucibacter sp. APW11]MDT9002264.1 phosphonate C-P lyase system protein PhnH [Paucibacter sp. APW11]
MNALLKMPPLAETGNLATAVMLGLREPVHGAQACFRALLTALSYPGRLQTLPPDVLAAELQRGLREQAALLAPASAALLLTLLDQDSTLQLAGAHGADATRRAALLRWLRFHTGVREAGIDAGGDFVLCDAAGARALTLSQLPLGSDEEPQQGCTLIIEVEGLQAGAGAALPGGTGGQVLRLRGPGIAGEQCVRVLGLDAAFWQQRIALQAEFPRGLELVLVCGEQLLALPRSSRIELMVTEG